MAVHRFIGVLMAAALGACAELGADQPLFSPADQSGAAPITEGIWIAVSDQCPERHARSRGRFPAECAPMDIRRAEDGAWRVSLRVDLASGLSAQQRAEAEEDGGPYRVIISPAVERTLASDSYAPLYLGEIRRETAESESVRYLVIAPVGAMPATTFVLLSSIGCDDALRDGPIDGVSERYEAVVREDGSTQGDLVGCTASTQRAVRQAARRAAIENLSWLQSPRYTYVRRD